MGRRTNRRSAARPAENPPRRRTAFPAGKIPSGEPLPATPALKDTVDALTAHLRDSTSATELNVLSELLQRIVQLGDKSDAAVMLTVARLTVLDASVPAVTIASLLRVMALVRASKPTTGATSGRYKTKHANATYKAT